MHCYILTRYLARRIAFIICGASLMLTDYVRASGADLGIPITGYVVDGSRQIRPILGLPGASSMGAPLAISSRTYASMLIAPAGMYALGIRALGRGLMLITNLSGKLSSTSIAGLPEPVQQLWLSPRGSSAAVLTRSGTALQIITGLPGNPVVSSTIDISAASEPINSLALSDNGAAVLDILGDSGSSELYRLLADAAPLPLGIVGNLSLAAFLPDSDDALLADPSTTRLTLYSDVSGTATSRIVTQDERLATASAIAGAAGRRTAFVASTDPGGVDAVDIATGQLSFFDCYCSPSTLLPLNGGNLFQLTESGTIRLMDLSSPDGRPTFVPEAASSAGRVLTAPLRRGLKP